MKNWHKSFAFAGLPSGPFTGMLTNLIQRIKERFQLRQQICKFARSKWLNIGHRAIGRIINIQSNVIIQCNCRVAFTLFSPALSYWFHGILIFSTTKLNQTERGDAFHSKPNICAGVEPSEVYTRSGPNYKNQKIYWIRRVEKLFSLFIGAREKFYLLDLWAPKSAIHCCVLLLILTNLYLLCPLITTAVILSFNNPEKMFNDGAGPTTRQASGMEN